VVVLGHNGSGKSTFAKSLNAILLPCGGKVYVEGMDTADEEKLYDIRQTVGMVFQKANPFPMSIYDNITYGPKLHGVRNKAELDELVETSLRGAALWDEVKDRLKKSALGLSGGQQQRIRFAIATMHDPNILILDEPTTGMDVTARRTFWERMDKLAETGKTIIFATHYLEEAQNFAQRIVLMRDGAIIADGTSEEIRDLTGYRHVSFLADAPLAFDDLPHQQVEITQENGKYRHRLNISDAEDFVRLLLNTQVVSDLEIVKPSMDESFMLLTSDTESAASSATKES